MIFGELVKPALRTITDMGPREIAIMAPLVVLTILFGVYPAPILDVTRASVKNLVAGYETAIKTAALK
jgi:NADH-quinone oxidoreductase subunit M